MAMDHLKISQYMTEQAHTIRAGETLGHAQDMLTKFGIRHLPVLDGGKLIGILSDRDIKSALSFKGMNLKNATAEDFCTQEVYVTHPDSTLKVVAEEMAEKRYGCAVVTEHGSEKVIGIFTTTDACKALAEVLA